MWTLIVKILVNALAVMGGAYLLKGVEVKSFGGAVATSVLLAVVNGTLGKVLNFILSPINWLTLGLVSLVVTTLMIMLVSQIYDGFKVKNFWWALGFGIVISILNGLMFSFI